MPFNFCASYAIYMLTIVGRGFFPQKDFDMTSLEGIKDPGWKMLLPLFVFTFCMVAFGLYSGPLVNFFISVAAGMY